MNRLVCLFLFIVSLFCLACKEVNQDPRDLFETEQFPKLLQKYKDETWMLNQHREEILSLIEANQNSDKLLVAVIDNGVDIFHPELLRYMNWQTDSERKISLGYSPLSGSYLSNANLVDASLFAFGAKAIKNGRIVGEPENPLELLEKMQNRFGELITAAIAKSSILKNSHFRKITNNNLSFLQAVAISESASKEDFRSYKEMLADGYIITTKAMRINQFDAYTRTDNEILEQAQRIFEPHWRASRKGDPNEIESLWIVEHADAFFKVLKKVVHQLDEEMQVKNAIRTYKEFALFSSENEKAHIIGQESIDLTEPDAVLRKALAYKLFGANLLSTQRFITDFTYRFTVNEKLASSHTQYLPVTISKQDILNQIERSLTRAKLSLEAIKKSSLDLEEKHQAKKQELALMQLVSVLGNVQSMIPELGDSLEFDIAKYKPTYSHTKQSLYELRRAHPFYVDGNKSESHGSHVAGAILLGNEDKVLIEPIRPLTFTMNVTYNRQIEIFESFMKEFESFLQDPVIYRGTKALLKQKGLNIPETKSAFIKSVLNLTRLEAMKSAKESAINFLFIDQVVDSIKHTGQRNILFANMSLGEDFDKESDDKGSGKTPKAEIFDFLRFEFSKYKISRAILDYAPNTLFFMAAGNGGSWVDGHSKSALPFDLTSTYFKQFETATQILPNHTHRNILGVLATDKHRLLSSFTNLPIHRSTPIVSALGEAVLSTVKRYDSELLGLMIKQNLADLDLENYINLSEKDKLEVIKRTTEPNAFATIVKNINELQGEERLDYINDLAYSADSLGTLSKIYLLRGLEKKTALARSYYDGTSMATPNALQASVRIIAERAKAQGIKLSELTGTEGFKPAQLIDLILSQTERLNSHAYILEIPYLKDVKTFNKSAIHKSIEKELKGLSKGKSCRQLFL